MTPEPTCRGATRHTFAFGNADVVRYLKRTFVGAHFDLDTHSVLFVDVDLPTGNPIQLKWPAPLPLEHADVDLDSAQLASVSLQDRLTEGRL